MSAGPDVEYAISLGWGLIPLIGKIPPAGLTGWRTWPRTTLDEVQRWYAQGWTNVGLRTGFLSGIFVIDVDPGADVSPLELPETLMAKTGRPGGMHYYFRMPKLRLTTSVGKLGPDIDTRGEGGYVVLPGSVHPDTGVIYEWINRDVEPVELPEHIIARLTQRPVGVATAKPARGASAYARKAFEDEVAAVMNAPAGAGNDRLNKAAFNLGQLVGGGQLDEHEVREALVRAAVPRRPEREARASVASGLTDGMAQPRRPRGRPPESRRTPVHGMKSPEKDPRPMVLIPGPHQPEDDDPVMVGNHDFVAAVMEAIPQGVLYMRGRDLGEIIGEPGSRVFLKCTESRLRTIIDAHAILYRWHLSRGKNAMPERVYEPAGRDHAALVAASAGLTGVSPRELAGIITAPTMRPDGSLLEAPGYDQATGLFFDLGPVTFSPVPASPTLESARAAMLELAEPFLEFPFMNLDAGLSVSVAAVLTLVARNAIDGCVPMFPVRSTTPGSGKGLLVDVVCLMGIGREPARMAAPAGKDSDNEWRKRIVAYGKEGDPAILVDNIEGALGSQSLAMALTARSMSERDLGFNRNIEAPLNGVWFATGNGLTFKGDLGRRVVPIDFDPHVEHPEDRQGPQPGQAWSHPDLPGYVRAHRPRLVTAALTMLRAFHLAGRPDHGRPLRGSFTEWDKLIRGCLIWSGGADPLEAAAVVRKEGDTELDALRAALACWHSAFQFESKTTAEMVDHAKKSDPELLVALAGLSRSDTAKLDGRSLGYALRRYKGRVVGGFRFMSNDRDLHTKLLLWRVEEACG